MKVSIEVVLLTELVCEGDTRKQFTPLALDWVDVKEHHQARKEADKHQQEDDDLAAFAIQVHAAEADVGQEGEGQEEARDEAAYVGEIVDPGQQPEGKEEEYHTQQLDEGPPGLGQDLPALEQLHEQAGQDPKLRASWTHLREKRKKNTEKKGNKLLTSSHRAVHCSRKLQNITSALYGRKMAEAKLPVMPLRM